MHKNTGRTSKCEIEQSHFSWHIDAHDVLRRMRTLGTLLYVIPRRRMGAVFRRLLHLHHGGHPLHLPGRSGKTLDHGPESAGLRWAGIMRSDSWEVESLRATKHHVSSHDWRVDHSQIMCFLYVTMDMAFCHGKKPVQATRMG